MKGVPFGNTPSTAYTCLSVTLPCVDFMHFTMKDVTVKGYMDSDTEKG